GCAGTCRGKHDAGRNFCRQCGTQSRGGQGMKTSVVMRLILKDWRLQRRMIVLSIASGVIALGILLAGGQTPMVIGASFFFISMMFCACMLPMTSISNERKKQNLPFLMSLPVSASRYGMAKLLST